MLISVIVPTYNRASRVVNALDSALAQAHQDLEVIVVDDGSTDDTADVLAERYGGDPRVVYIHQEQLGVAAARNTALDRARGELVAFLDSDDVWCPWKLEFQLACMARTPDAGMIWTDMKAVDAEGNVVPGSSVRDILSFRFSLEELFDGRISLAELPETPSGWGSAGLYHGDIYAKMVLGNLVLPSSVLMTRARLTRVGRFDETLEIAGEDFDFFLRVCREGAVAFADVPSVQYQVGRSDQLTHPSKTLYLARNYLRTLQGALARDPERIDLPPSTVREAVAYGHTWTAQAYIMAGETKPAWRHLRAAVRLGNRRALGLTFAAIIPAGIRARVLELARRLLGHRKGAAPSGATAHE